ncbi:MAG: hypothetical protein KGJ62_11930 [Armatimonadetes bacterium]|nr:hypothetical protein [Armatimonadota bacterium]MDE2206414.1 hypothetical protein [Armatimonadota bacterium]
MITLVSISYTVDPVGNRTGETVGSTSTSCTMDNDGQLKSITQGTAVTAFGYDALGRRVSRTASGTTTSTQYAGGAPVTETQGSSFTAAYTVGNDLLRRNGEYPAFDALGSVRAETNSSGTATARQDFDAFGNTIARSGSTSSPYNFAGDWTYQSDGDAGLLHVGARYYDPQVGRFASRDSMLDQIPYAYCGGEPNDFVDPSGRLPEWLRFLAYSAGDAMREIGDGPVKVIGGAVAVVLIVPVIVVAVVDGRATWGAMQTVSTERKIYEQWVARGGNGRGGRIDEQIRKQQAEAACGVAKVIVDAFGLVYHGS